MARLARAGEDIVLRCGDKSLVLCLLFQGILQTEAGLRALGVGPGELVTLFSLNTPEAVMAFYAIDRIGAVANWVDMKVSPAEVEEYLTQAGSQVALVLEVAFSKVYHHRGKAPTQHFVVLPLAPYVAPELEEAPILNTWQQGAGPDCLSWADFLRPPAQVPPGQTGGKSRWPSPTPGHHREPAKGVVLSGGPLPGRWSTMPEQRRSMEEGFALVLLRSLCCVWPESMPPHPALFGDGGDSLSHVRPHDLGEMLRRYRPEQVCGTTAYWQFLLQDAWVAEANLSFLKGAPVRGEMYSRQNWNGGSMPSWPRAVPLGSSRSTACPRRGIMCVSYGAWEDGDVGRRCPAAAWWQWTRRLGPSAPRRCRRALIQKSGGDEWLLPPARGRPPSAETWSMAPSGYGQRTQVTSADGRVVVTGQERNGCSPATA